MGQARNNYVIYVTVAFETYTTVESACLFPIFCVVETISNYYYM